MDEVNLDHGFEPFNNLTNTKHRPINSVFSYLYGLINQIGIKNTYYIESEALFKDLTLQLFQKNGGPFREQVDVVLDWNSYDDTADISFKINLDQDGVIKFADLMDMDEVF